MKKTKIICSMGPASYQKDTMRKMIQNGMNVARINFSHATLEERKTTEDLVHYFNEEENANIAILFDTKGPDFRTGNFLNDQIELVDGETIRIVKEDILGTKDKITVNYKQAIDNIAVGAHVLLDDGMLTLEVISKEEDGITCRIIHGGVIKSRRGINVPGVKLNLPFISAEDEADIKYACEHNGDFLGISFVSTEDDVKAARALLTKYGSPEMQIITKVETATAIEHLDAIIEESDAIMVARGDLGVEVPMQQLPILQKLMIEKCRAKGKICIVATEMLASMYTSARPTRAEVSDIANAVLDGTDAVMLSGETTIGKYPADAVKFMADICENTELYLDYDNQLSSTETPSITSTIAKCVVESANALEAKLIVAATITGYTAKEISAYRPSAVILAACPDTKVSRSLALDWGVYTTIVPIYNNTDEVIAGAKEQAKKFMDLKTHDMIVMTGGFPNSAITKSTNLLKIEEI